MAQGKKKSAPAKRRPKQAHRGGAPKGNQNAVGNKGGRGREFALKPEHIKIAKLMAKLGCTDTELADELGISARTLYNWKAKSVELNAVLKVQKAEFDQRVERALYQRATGYEQDAVKIFMPQGAVEPVYAPFRERIAPDTTAAIFWLKNRQPDQWRDRSVGDKENPLHIAPGKHDASEAQLLAIALKAMHKKAAEDG